MVDAASVVVELVAQTRGYNSDINTATRNFESGMNRTSQSAERTEQVVSAANRRIVISTGQSANATRNLGRQVADIGASLASGSSPFLVFAQQAPQVADALADTGGKAAKVASFFAGPWGAALLAAGSVVGVLADKLLSSGDAADKAVPGLNRYLNTLDGVRKRVQETADAIANMNATEGSRRVSDIDSATRTAITAQANVNRLTPLAARGGTRAANQEAAVARQQLREQQTTLFIAQRQLAYLKRVNTEANAAQASSGAGRGSGRLSSPRSTAIRIDVSGADKIRDLDAALTRIRGQFDPASEAAQKYDEAVETINALEAAGKIDDATAALYRFRAAAEKLRDTPPLVTLQKNSDVTGDLPGVREVVDGIDARRAAEMEANQEVAAQQEQNIRDLADLFTESFTAGSGDIFENFKRQGLRALAVLIARFAVLQATQGNGGFGNILKNIGGAFNQGGGIAGIAGMFGRASGGYVGAGQLVRVNEGASPGNVEGWRPQGSGNVIPLGRMKAARPSGGTTVLQTIAVDARGAVMADTFARQILARADGNARQVVGAASTAQRKALPAASARLSQLGTSG